MYAGWILWRVSRAYERVSNYWSTLTHAHHEAFDSSVQKQRKQKRPKTAGPKRPLSAYMLWLSEHREEIKASLRKKKEAEPPVEGEVTPTDPKPVEITREAGRLWNCLNVEEKASYQERAKAAKEAHVIEMAAAKASQEDSATPEPMAVDEAKASQEEGATTKTKTKGEVKASQEESATTEPMDVEETKSLKPANQKKTKTVPVTGGAPIAVTDYNPGQSRYHPVNDACWCVGEPVPYQALARTLEQIEATSGRLDIVRTLTNFFR